MKFILVFASVAVCWWIRKKKSLLSSLFASSSSSQFLSFLSHTHVKAVAIDLDGTLLSSHHSVSQETKQTLSLLHASGRHIIIATGRTLAECMQWTSFLPRVVHFASCNGAHIADWKEGECTVRLKRVIQPAAALEIVKTLLQNNIRFCLFELGHAYVSKKEDIEIFLQDATKVSFCENFRIHEKSENIMSLMIPVHNQPQVLALPTTTTTTTTTDISPSSSLTTATAAITTTTSSSTPSSPLSPSLTRAEILAQAAKPIVSLLMSLNLHDLGVQVIQSSTSSGQGSYIDIISVNAGKEPALKELCEYLRIQMQEIVSFGDSDNDLGMLRATGWSIAPANGNANAKQAAKMVSQWSNDEDCVRKELQHLLNVRK